MMYNVNEQGVITAIRIFYKEDGVTPMAELVFALGGSVTIEWTNAKIRKEYEKGINGYTFFFDERIEIESNSLSRYKH